MLASHAQGKGGPDTIFAYSGMAIERAQEIGKENIVNATIGAFLESDGSLKTMETVETALRNLPFNVMANYAPIDGLPDYLEAIMGEVFRDVKPDAYVGAIATPGGTGALHNAFYNYLEAGESCLTTSYFWGNYATLLEEIDRKLETFNMFTEDDDFDMASFKAHVKDLRNRQRNVMILLNTPAHNPTGYTISDEDWDEIIAFLKEMSDENHKMILVLDVAYIDYARPEARQFLKKLTNLGEHMLAIICASMSKGFTMYGFRLGAMIGVTSEEKIRDDFLLANGASARGTWSNCSRPAMEVLINLYENPDKWQAFVTEQKEFADLLAHRAHIFTEEAKEVDLPMLPYDAGFFIMLPCEDHAMAKRVASKLREDDIFTVPLGTGVRLAICAIDDDVIKGLAARCKKAYDKALTN